MAKITVIIPIYNMESFMLKSINTVIEQSISDIEILCINDASTDESLAILLSLAQKDSRIRIISNKTNLGVAKCRNIGIENANGECITFFDADDSYPPYALETLYNALKSSNASISKGNLLVFDSALMHLKPLSPTDACFLTHTKEEVDPLIYSPLFFPGRHQAFMFKKSFLLENNIYYPDLLAGEDRIFIVHAICHARLVAVCPEIVYYYRANVQHNRKRSSQYQLDEIKHYLECYKIYEEHENFTNATFFIYATLEGELHPLLWFKRTKEQKKITLEMLKLFTSSKEYNTDVKDFAPYPLNIQEIQKNARMLITYPRLFSFIRIYEKIKNRFFAKKS